MAAVIKAYTPCLSIILLQGPLHKHISCEGQKALIRTLQETFLVLGGGLEGNKSFISVHQRLAH